MFFLFISLIVKIFFSLLFISYKLSQSMCVSMYIHFMRNIMKATTELRGGLVCIHLVRRRRRSKGRVFIGWEKRETLSSVLNFHLLSDNFRNLYDLANTIIIIIIVNMLLKNFPTFIQQHRFFWIICISSDYIVVVFHSCLMSLSTNAKHFHKQVFNLPAIKSY